jgi:hypothetical protein
VTRHFITYLNSFESGPLKRGARPSWGFRCVISGHVTPPLDTSWVRYTQRTLSLLLAHSASAILAAKQEDFGGDITSDEAVHAARLSARMDEAVAVAPVASGADKLQAQDVHLFENVLACEGWSNSDLAILAREKCRELAGIVDYESNARAWIKQEVENVGGSSERSGVETDACRDQSAGVEGGAASDSGVDSGGARVHDNSDAQVNLELRERYVDAARCVAFACLLKVAGRGGAGEKRDEDLVRMWNVAQTACVWLVRAHQTIKMELLAREHSGVPAAAAAEDVADQDDVLALSRRAYEDVMASLRARAYLILLSSPRTKASERVPSAEKDVVSFLLNTRVDARALAARIKQANQAMSLRARAVNAMHTLLGGVWGGSKVAWQDSLRIFAAVVPSEFAHVDKMCEPSRRSAVIARFRDMLKVVEDIVDQCDTRNAGAMELRLALLHILAKHGAYVDHFGEGFQQTLRRVWGMMYEREREQAHAHAHKPVAALPVIDYAKQYEIMQQGDIKVHANGQELSLTCSYWCPVRVLEKCDDAHHVLVSLLGFADGMQCHVPLENLSIAPQQEAAAATGGLQQQQQQQQQQAQAEAATRESEQSRPGDEVDVLLSCALAEGAGGVWVPAVILSKGTAHFSCESGGVAQAQGCATVRLVLDQSADDKARVVTVKSSCVRPRKSATQEVSRSKQIGAAKVHVSKDMCAKAHVTVSTASNLAGRLLDRNMETYWQSDGSKPHWINLAFPKKIRVQVKMGYSDYVVHVAMLTCF